MNNHATHPSTPNARPSKLGGFLSGFSSGAMNGAIMMGLYSGVVLLLKATGAAMFGSLSVLPLGAIAATVLATGCFSGVMRIKNALFSNGQAHSASTGIERNTTVLVPTISQSVTPQLELAEAAEVETSAPTRSWSQRVGQGTGSQSRVDQILANGSMSDKDRAAAILASREQAATQGNSIG